MIDLNTLISNALIAAVQQAVAPLNERIATLELQRGEMQRTIVTYSERITALENNPAQGVDTQAPSVLAAQYTPISNEQIKAALQEWATKDSLLEHLDNQEWFWSKINDYVERQMDDHLQTYDHDDYDSAVSKLDDMPDLDDYVTRDEVRSEIEDVLNNATLSLSI